MCLCYCVDCCCSVVFSYRLVLCVFLFNGLPFVCVCGIALSIVLVCFWFVLSFGLLCLCPFILLCMSVCVFVLFRFLLLDLLVLFMCCVVSVSIF